MQFRSAHECHSASPRSARSSCGIVEYVLASKLARKRLRVHPPFQGGDSDTKRKEALHVSKRKETVVRMLGRAVQIVYGPVGTGMSGIEPDKSAIEARKLLKKLQLLANKDPENRFGIVFVRLQLKLLRHLRNSKR